ncbi:MAG: hypothetical protein ACD_66C00252G0005 [uncultured bacterium]|uniref:Uncharacterized protein n=1 Tax=Candidatus Uhrbacteria bacterium GW2011_GWC1_41_20 TaxID=1618983 RepID=A0A0G0VFA3_9BACT|nr:MAG: hypothetical protein ACD_66C00252G0005 [uncultured bacterium]KKR22800.1 MAG: hypothetical protein UT52_C0007G0020 [Candidatus Uhrbacteria bacterium GW2011_GWE1_39_46]KKR64156.1 MAG: hypothetical protein UU04_C0005G0020 [Candidatus Uhrbacteria bacterium GW2011_GWC2_40_450]KKR89070.1 MAG: hypothetical protein UU36_C0037G0001 [Candidatus Uhrbacteria bacterium GW2011_GWE2_41_1153]KKR90291.1 MAG: hypothetical protein UU40_C0005G0020 [Candidatus Uhrbacteria bacterium GW2011_GWD2_41_121]KKR95
MREGQHGEGQISPAKPEGIKKNIALSMIERGRDAVEKKSLRKKQMEALRGIGDGAEVMLYARKAQVISENSDMLLTLGMKKEDIDMFVNRVEEEISLLSDTLSDPNISEDEGNIRIQKNILKQLQDNLISSAKEHGYVYSKIVQLIQGVAHTASFDEQDLPQSQKDSIREFEDARAQAKAQAKSKA